MRRTIRARVIVGTAVAVFLLVAIISLTFRTIARLIEDNGRVSHSYEVLVMLERTRNAIVDAEAGQRGYLITGRDIFLTASRTAMIHVDARLAALGGLIADHPSQRGRIADLRSRIKHKFGIMEEAVGLRSSGVSEADLRRLVGGEGRATMEEIRSRIDQLGHEERRRLVHRLEESRASTRQAFLAYSILLALVLVLLGSSFALLGRDVSRRKREAEALRRSRERFELAVLGSRDGLWDWDLTTDEVYFSPRWKSMLGHEDSEIPGRFEEWKSRIHPDDVDRAMATIAAYQEGATDEYELEHRLRHKDGSYRWILARGVALRDPEGRPYRMSGSHTDITARKQAERRLAEQNRQLEEAARSEREALDALKKTQAYLIQSEKLASLGQLVAGVAHEINNPLAFVINNVAVMSRDVGPLLELLRLYKRGEPVLARAHPELVETIRRHAIEHDLEYTVLSLTGMIDRTGDGLGRIRQIVTDLRNFARLDEGETKESDLNSGIVSTVHIILGHARKEDVELEMDLTPLPPVLCNPVQINQVVLNLVTNAIDACSAGGKVTVRTRATSHGVEIHVLDSGSGIDPAILDKIFDPFFTTKPVGQGTGLGLSISYGIIAEHGGRIEVESTPGEGAHVCVHLPLRPALPPKSNRRAAPRHSPP